MSYISIFKITSLEKILFLINKKNLQFLWRTKIIQDVENHFLLNKLKMIFNGKNKNKFFITLIFLSLTMKKIKILSTNIPFSWKKSPTNSENNGKSKLINYLNRMHRADKYL